MRLRLLAMVGSLALAACTGPPPQQNYAIYPVHSYGCCAEMAGDTSWHSGQHVTLHWQQMPLGTTTNLSGNLIVLSASLTGPFPTVDALKQATSGGTTPAGVRTVSATPVSVNDRANVEPASQLDLPADLAPGYYNLATQAATGAQSWGGAAIVIVVR